MHCQCATDPCLFEIPIDTLIQDRVNSFQCTCPKGFTGITCAINIDECATSPCVHGSCNDRINSYKCTCQPGWTGANCTYNIDDCVDSPCHNGGTCTVSQYFNL